MEEDLASSHEWLESVVGPGTRDLCVRVPHYALGRERRKNGAGGLECAPGDVPEDVKSFWSAGSPTGLSRETTSPAKLCATGRNEGRLLTAFPPHVEGVALQVPDGGFLFLDLERKDVPAADDAAEVTVIHDRKVSDAFSR